ncbi:hypothetical protein KHA80_09505 [Anaerobacillus sp. HL2]|nr:hypothetical protein KHA80_09505 [Anaerobacillus sp. HL2]
MPLGFFTFFFIVIIIAKITGHWNTNISYEEFKFNRSNGELKVKILEIKSEFGQLHFDLKVLVYT